MEDVDISLDTLVHDSETLIPVNDELYINRSLHELQHAGARLTAKRDRGPQAQVEAAMYYASRGFDLNRHVKALKQIRYLPSRRAEPLSEIDDMGRYLDRSRATCIMDTIRDSQVMQQRHFRESYEKKFQEDWEQAKVQILEHLGTIPNFRTRASALAEPLALPPSKRMYQPSLEPIKERYAEATKQFVEAIKKQSSTFQPAAKYQSIHQSLHAYSLPDDRDSQNFVNIWQMLGFIVGEKVLDVNGQPRRNKKEVTNYRKLYESKDKKLQFELCYRAKLALEHQYAQYIRDEISKSKNRGGTPGLEHDIQNFVCHYFKDAIPPSYETMEFPDYRKLPTWAVIYFCLRCGCLQGALNTARRAKRHHLVRAIESMIQRPRELLPEDVWKSLCTEYNTTVKSVSSDPFKIAVYCIVAKADPNPKPAEGDMSEIKSTIEDFLWIRLSMIWERDEEPPSWLPYGNRDNIRELFSMISLESLVEVIEKNRNALLQEDASQKFYFASILLVLQEFEQCIKHLECNGHLIEAVHVALVLNWYGLLRSREVHLESTVNLGKLVSKLVAQVSLVDCDLAFFYFYLLRETPNMKNQYNFHDTIVENLSHSRCNCSKVVGTVSGRQVILNGNMSKYVRSQEIFRLCLNAGKKAQQEGSFLHAMELYTLAGAFNHVGTMLVRLLRRVVTKPRSDETKQSYFRMADKFQNHYQFHASSHPRGVQVEQLENRIKTDLVVSMQLCQAFDYFSEGPTSYNRALQAIDDLGILPTGFGSNSREQTWEAQQRILQRLSERGETVRALFSPVCDLVMDVLLQKVEDIKPLVTNQPDEPTFLEELAGIKSRTLQLNSFLGRLREVSIEIDEGVNRKLVDLTNAVSLY